MNKTVEKKPCTEEEWIEYFKKKHFSRIGFDYKPKKK